MATIIDPENAQDVDQPLNTDPDYRVTHVFSTDDVTGTFGGLTQGDVEAGDMPVVDFSADPKLTKEGIELYPINSEFGYHVTDFEGAVAKEFSDGLYEEGFIGNLTNADGDQIGVVVSDAPTDTFKTPAVLGTWLSGLGGNSVKASTEHYVVMQNILSDQKFPGDPDAEYALDDNLFVIGGDYDGHAVQDLLDGTVSDGAGGFITIADENQDGVVDIKDILNPNESTVEFDIAASSDYSVTVKDDGKLLYRWGNMIKKPNDIRLEAQLDLPEEWSVRPTQDSLQPLFRITSAEVVMHHTITNNPNDQIRPEDLENEAAIGTLPTYEIVTDYNEDGEGPREVWRSTDGYYAGDGTFYEAGTILRDANLATNWAASDLARIGAADGEQGFTNAWYTTMNREPFEPVLDGDEYGDSGPRWRLKPDKYGQDLPGVTIPTDPSATANPQKDQVKYEVGAETQTVINLLDWATPFSPMSLSAGFQNNAGNVSANGVNMSEKFDLAVYIKGDIKPATLYSAELLMDYEEIAIHDVGADFVGGAGDDYIAGQGDNELTGGAGNDMFILSYGAQGSSEIVGGSIITDFTAGEDALGFIGLGADHVTLDTAMAATNITQTVVGGDLSIAIDGVEVVVLEGVTDALGAESFYTSTQSSGAATVTGTTGSDTLEGDDFANNISGLEGNDTLEGLGGDDTLDGGTGDDSLVGGTGSDTLLGGEDNDTLYGNTGDDVLFGHTGDDYISGGDGDDELSGGDGADSLLGMTGDDLLNGGGGVDILWGSFGNDTLYGNAGDDELLGGADNDQLFGGDDNDTLDGGSGNDSLYGNIGTDTLDGGAGNDFLRGGIYADTFVFEDGDGADIIDDFVTGEDTLQLDDAIWGGGLSAQQVLDTYGSVVSSLYTLDFGDGQTITFNGTVTASALVDDLVFV